MCSSAEIRSGAGGQALQLERAGFDHLALVENHRHACTHSVQPTQWGRVRARPATLRPDPLRGSDLMTDRVPYPKGDGDAQRPRMILVAVPKTFPTVRWRPQRAWLAWPAVSDSCLLFDSAEIPRGLGKRDPVSVNKNHFHQGPATSTQCFAHLSTIRALNSGIATGAWRRSRWIASFNS